MKIAAAYIFVVVVWATTPLAIFFSTQDLGFLLSLSVRMLLGVVLVVLTLPFIGAAVVAERRFWLTSAIASIGVFPSMPLVYWSTGHIPTGLVSLLFSSAPFFVGLLSKIVLRETMGMKRSAGIAVAFVGLVVVFIDQMRIGIDSVLGILAMLLATSLFAISAVMMKKQNSQVPPVQQSGGSMFCALPGLWLSWWFTGGELPATVHWQPTMALVYLAVVASVLGFSAYYYLLKHLSASSVSLVSMISPVLAIVLGVIFKGEQINAAFLFGALILLFGLLIYSDLTMLFKVRLGKNSAANKFTGQSLRAK
ncbi:DMT family transporter [Halioxenophilus sp. WMMB6]|uniref:DMT family transporter n=1 Tax=Halioxenophilus sp. WMMB6 TaxID=3073815 RepID=UPI00295E2DDB|nr:DMT family transporter [Halioxenophilus sp. WMMB6]